MAFFKKKASPEEFGEAVVYLALDWLASDAGRALGMRFENFDGSDGWARFLESRGVPTPVQKLHFRLFTHCAIQATYTQFDERTRRAMTQGGISGFRDQPDGYDFATTYDTLEDAYNGQYEFDDSVEALSNLDAQVSFLPNPSAGVLNAKYLMEEFVVPNMENSEAFFDDFEGFSSACCASIGTVQRAVDEVSRKFKLS